jgi:hypothetical protein
MQRISDTNCAHARHPNPNPDRDSDARHLPQAADRRHPHDRFSASLDRDG